MLILGLLLILAAAAVIAYVLLATAGMTAVEISYGVLNVEVAPLWLFLSGVLTLAVAAIGVAMAAAGARSKTRKAREVRELRKQAKDADRRAVRTSDASTLGQRSAAADGPRPARPSSSSAPSTGPTVVPRQGPAPAPERNRLDPDR